MAEIFGNFRQQAHYANSTTRLDNVNNLQHSQFFNDFSYTAFPQQAHGPNSTVIFELAMTMNQEFTGELSSHPSCCSLMTRTTTARSK